MYIVRYTDREPEMAGRWTGPVWKQTGTLQVSHFRPESSSHRPKTLAKLLYSRQGIAGIFHVEDNFVRCVHNNYLDPVYKDSCVGIVLRPGQAAEYFSFEFNCGGAIRASFITIADDTKNGLKVFMPLSKRDGAAIRVYHSLPAIVDPEIAVPTVWILEFFIPFSVIGKFVCKPGNIKGDEWRANLYKCGDATSQPHWASWVSLPSKNLQPPQNLGKIRFA
jgi:hypothetical protein